MDILKVEKLCKKLNGFSLQDVSFTLPGGCILGYVGENGAGKSTTIQTMFGLFHKDDGDVLFCGQPYDAEDQTQKEQIAVIFDDVCYHDCLTPVQIGKSMAGIYQTWSNETYGNMLERFHLPQKKPVKDFSRGMKMKLNLAVAFSHDTRLLVLDEATSGLDVVVREELFDLFREYVSDEEHAILISSHILSDLEKVCDYIAFISDGKILLSDDKDSLLERYCVIKCTKEQLDELDQTAIIGVRENAFSVEALAFADRVPDGILKDPATLEDIMMYHIKGGY